MTSSAAASGDNELHGGDQGDKIAGESGKDFLDGRRGDDNVLLGGRGRDRLLGDSKLFGGPGNDKLDGHGYVFSTRSPTTSKGGGGNDRITGDGNHDKLKARPGSDRVPVKEPPRPIRQRRRRLPARGRRQ